jgi:transposase
VNETDDEARPAARAVPDRALLTDAQWARLAPLLPPQQPKTGHVRRTLRQRGIGAVIPTRKDQRRNPHFDRAAYRTRERVERLKQFRLVATRYEKRGHHYLAFVTLAAIILWLPV